MTGQNTEDCIFLQDDLKGVSEAQNYWQAYFDKYTFEHEVLCGAVDKEDGAAFSFWLDRVRTTINQFMFSVFRIIRGVNRQ